MQVPEKASNRNAPHFKFQIQIISNKLCSDNVFKYAFND